MAKQLNVLARAESASLLVSTSRRTPHDFAEMLAAALEVPSFVHRWDLGSDPNPYSAYLELADAFVVTGDSASMLSEACGTGRRVWFVDPPTELSATTRTLHWLGDHALSSMRPWSKKIERFPWAGRSSRRRRRFRTKSDVWLRASPRFSIGRRGEVADDIDAGTGLPQEQPSAASALAAADQRCERDAADLLELRAWEVPGTPRPENPRAPALHPASLNRCPALPGARAPISSRATDRSRAAGSSC
jgi:hypothetical protein